jgi:hypothetical protein
MRLLVLYPLQPRRASVLYLRRLAWSLERHGHVVYGVGRENYIEGASIEEVIERLGPFDAILSMEAKYVYRWLGEQLKSLKMKKAILLSDCYPYKGQLGLNSSHLDRSGYDLLFYQTVAEGYFLKDEMKRAEKMVYLPMSVDTTYFRRPAGLERDIDISAVWNWNAPRVYPSRKIVLDHLTKMPFKVFTDPVFYDDYVDLLYRTKIFVSCGTIYKNSQSRFAEVPACECLLMTDVTLDMEPQGWKDGDNLVVYNTLDELEKKVIFFLRNDRERERIAKRGYDHVLANFTNDVIIKRVESELASL